jgi:hypothetical protein
MNSLSTKVENARDEVVAVVFLSGQRSRSLVTGSRGALIAL